jgi:hypothetical protein
MAAETQQCPICSKPVKPYPRYPHYLCRECAAKATSPDGRALRFSNEDASGGFVAEYADTGEPYLGHECFVNGVKCYADEARFGGIVIEAMA